MPDDCQRDDCYRGYAHDDGVHLSITYVVFTDDEENDDA